MDKKELFNQNRKNHFRNLDIIRMKAWYPEMKEMFWVDSINKLEICLEKGNDINDTFYRGQLKVLIKDIILLRYVGLKDINDKKIYEGDIVKYDNLFFEIYFDIKYAGFNFKIGDNKTTSFFHYELIRKIEIIGNIYENPKLLEENING